MRAAVVKVLGVVLVAILLSACANPPRGAGGYEQSQSQRYFDLYKGGQH